MPPEPKKPIEELLEASAQKRRAEFGADPKMPNPMRARLQDEIAALTRGREPEPRARWFGLTWPRLVMGAAFASLVCGAFGLWWQARETPGAGARLAMRDRAPAKEMDRLETAAAPAAQSMPAAHSDKLADSPGVVAKSAAGTGLADNDRTARNENESLSLAKPAEKNSSPLEVLTRPAARPAIASASAGQKEETKKLNFKQQLSSASINQAFRRDAKALEATKILDSFQVEQDGAQIRVVDDDGSTYTGHIERLARDDGRSFYKEKQSDAAKSSGGAALKTDETNKAASNEFYFRAAGYNGSLQKSLVFEGNYIVTALPEQPRLKAALAKDVAQGAARIVGTAKVPGEPPVQVDAVTIPPK